MIPRLVCALCALALPAAAWAQASPAGETVEQHKERIVEIENSGKFGFHNFALCREIKG